MIPSCVSDWSNKYLVGSDATGCMWPNRYNAQQISESRQTMNEKPTPPADNECCESGCEPCVWDLYREELAQWEKEQKEAVGSEQDNGKS